MNIKDIPTNATNKRAVRKGWETFLTSGEYNIFGTLKFCNSKELPKTEAEQIFKRYWWNIDRIIFGRNFVNKHKAAVTRFCVCETGSFDNNHHMHFLIQNPLDSAKKFASLLNAYWSDFDSRTAKQSESWIVPIIDPELVSRYVTKTYGQDAFDKEPDAFSLNISKKCPSGIEYHQFRNEFQTKRIESKVSETVLQDASTLLSDHICKSYKRREDRAKANSQNL